MRVRSCSHWTHGSWPRWPSSASRPRTRKRGIGIARRPACSHSTTRSSTRSTTRLATMGLLASYDHQHVGGRENRDAVFIYRYYLRLSRASDAACRAQEEAERSRVAARVPLVPVDHHGNPMPLALGMLLAHALGHKDGMLNEHYRVVPDWITRADRLAARAQQPGIFLFSNYIWSHGQQPGALGDASRRRTPTASRSTAVPTRRSTRATSRRYFREQPARRHRGARRGRGHDRRDARRARRPRSATVRPDLSPSARRRRALVPRRRPSRPHRGAGPHRRARQRSRRRSSPACSTCTPRPDGRMAIIETNRGCPYGCTFCDWGSATLSRIRKFDLERVVRRARVVRAAQASRDLPRRRQLRHLRARRRDRGEGRRAEGHATATRRSSSTNYAKNTTST